MSTALDHVAKTIFERSPQYFRAIMMAPIKKRPIMIALIGLDMELWTASNSSQEDIVSAIRVSWWKDALEAIQNKQNEHPVLEACIEANIDIKIALDIQNAYAQERESLPVLVMATSQHLGANNAALEELMDQIGQGTHKPKYWPKTDRPVVAMLLGDTRLKATKLALLGRA